MRTKTVAVAATTTIIATFALAPSALAKGKDSPAHPRAHVASKSTPSSASTDQSGLASLTGLLTGPLSGLGLGPGNGKGNGKANGQANGKGAANGKGDTNGKANGKGGGGQQSGSVSIGGSSSSPGTPTPGTPSAGSPTGALSSSPTSGSTGAASSSVSAHGAGSTKTITSNAPAPVGSAAPRLETAPEDAPSLPSQDGRGAAATTTARPEQQQAVAYPTSMNDVEDGTAVLVGVLIVFMIGVTSVVVSAGYRSRRASHRVR